MTTIAKALVEAARPFRRPLADRGYDGWLQMQLEERQAETVTPSHGDLGKVFPRLLYLATLTVIEPQIAP